MRNPSRSRSLKGWVLLVTRFLTCPCHLPLLAALFAGTALGGFLWEYLPFLLPLTGPSPASTSSLRLWWASNCWRRPRLCGAPTSQLTPQVRGDRHRQRQSRAGPQRLASGGDRALG